MAKEIIELTSENFDEMTSKGNWAIDFWAEWCGPCKMMAPEFDKAALELKDKVRFGKVNVDEQTDIAQKFEVMSIPSMVLLKNGKEADRTVGALEKSDIIDAVNSAFK